jgi:TRAP-type C4-dicarboxylate transport system permease small subunit
MLNYCRNKENEMAEVKEKLITIYHFLDKLLDYYLVLSFILMIVFAFAQVIIRYVFSYPAPWTEESARYFMISMIFIGAGIGVRNYGHIRIEIIDMIASAQTLKKLQTISNILGFLVSGIYLYFSIKCVAFLIETHDMSITLGISIAWPASTMIIGSFLMTFYFLIHIIEAKTKKG